MNIWKSEMTSCCRMNIEALYKRLMENKEGAGVAGFLLSSGIAAAPHDETLFDSVTFYVKTVDNGSNELIGKVHYWHPTDGPSDKTAIIRTFDDIDKCMEWLTDKWQAIDESAGVMAEKCH